ncbi:putative transposase [Burkholderia pseudomallei TSV28]|nr:putative transposase [Burkholderia pseudomallei TSV28]
MRIVGLDVSRSVAEIAYLEDGTLHAGGRTGLRRDELERFAAKLRATDHVVLEATGIPLPSSTSCARMSRVWRLPIHCRFG